MMIDDANLKREEEDQCSTKRVQLHDAYPLIVGVQDGTKQGILTGNFNSSLVKTKSSKF